MPSRNVVKEFEEDHYYHVYNRGVEKRHIFTDDLDYNVFLGLLKKYLTGISESRNNRHSFTPLTDKVSLIAYCLMPTHFHLLLYQSDQDAIIQLMRRVSTGYAMYFNNRHKRVGPLFQSRYKASKIGEDAYLQHVSRYIHLNPDGYRRWPYSSLPYYQGYKKAAWVDTDRLLNLFDSRQEYLDFVDDYEACKREIDFLRWQLADGAEAEMKL